MQGWLLQDWVTLRAKNSGGALITSIAQGSESWIDIDDVEDLTFFLDIRELTTPSIQTIFYETSPTEQESSFVTMASLAAPSVGRAVTRVNSNVAGYPPARFVRWRIGATSNGGDWDITFRIWLATYAWVKP
jgi:hypothetical protein